MKLTEKFTSEFYYENQTEHEILETSSNIKLQHFFGFDDYHLHNLTDAMKRGKTVRSYKIQNVSRGRDGKCMVNIFYPFDFDLSKLWEFCENLPWQESEWGGWTEVKTEINEIEVIIYRSEEKAIRYFNPLNLDVYKPLKSVPEKMTLTHALRALINGQYEHLKCNGVYTDDYAGDAACNCQRGEIKDGIKFARRILESPNGWWTLCDENLNVSICCHSFDSNEFKLKI